MSNEALSKVGKGVWSAFVILGAIVSALLVLGAQDHKLAVAAATEVISPLEKRVDAHIAEDDLLKKQHDKETHRIFVILNALCASNHANCPQGE